MPRRKRIVVVGYPHHITQRGNYQQKTFVAERDYRCYLNWIKEYSLQYKMKVLAYCLMPNHVHFIAIPEDSDSLAKTFKLSQMRYSHYYHAIHKRMGHLWQGRFYSCVLDKEHLFEAIRYVENNPVKADLVKKAEDWKWSSARSHLFGEENIIQLFDVKEYFEVDDWRIYLERSYDKDIQDKIIKNTKTGRPSGGDIFISNLEKLLGIVLRPNKGGRLKKTR